MRVHVFCLKTSNTSKDPSKDDFNRFKATFTDHILPYSVFQLQQFALVLQNITQTVIIRHKCPKDWPHS